ncbi:MAG: M50 family metallopeptidase [Candidatus Helarchaeota archaeon]
MGKRGFILLSLLILVSSLFTIFYSINIYRKDYETKQTTEFYDIYFLNKNDGWLVGDSDTHSYIFISHDGGESWEKFCTPISAQHVQFQSKQIGWILGNGEIYKSYDGGATWNLQTDTLDYAKTFYFANKTIGWVITSWIVYSLFITRDGGDSWSPQITFPNFAFPFWNALNDVFFINESHGWMLYQMGIYGGNFSTQILHTNNSGESWVTSSSTINMSVTKFYFKDHMNGWAFGPSGELYYTNDSGITWQNQSSLVNTSLNDIYFLNNTTGWICGANGTLLHTRNGGYNWTNFSNRSLYGDLRGVFFPTANSGYIIGATSGIFVSYDAGQTWQSINIHFGTSWILILILWCSVLLVISLWLIYKMDWIKRSHIIKQLKTFFNNALNTLFTIETKKQVVVSCIFILGMIFGFNFWFSLIHEYGHGFSAILHGGYYEYIEMDLTGYGRVYINGAFNSIERVLIYFAGFLSELIVASLLICFLFLFFRRNKFLSFISIIIYIVGILGVLFYYGIIQMSPNPIGGVSDIFYISNILHVPPFVICLFLLPFFILSIYLGNKLVLYFYRSHLDSKKPFLNVLILGILISLGIFGIFITLPKSYGIIFY